MNHLLQHMSWTGYLTGVLLLIIAYYLFIGARFYRADLQQAVRRLYKQQTAATPFPAGPRYTEPAAENPGGHSPAYRENQRQEMPCDNDRLAVRLKACIAKASDQLFAPAVLVSQLKKIIQEYPELAASPERPAINQLIVNECEKTGTALLTEEEADQWWSA